MRLPSIPLQNNNLQRIFLINHPLRSSQREGLTTSQQFFTSTVLFKQHNTVPRRNFHLKTVKPQNSLSDNIRRVRVGKSNDRAIPGYLVFIAFCTFLQERGTHRNFLIGFQSNHSTENKLRALTGSWGARLDNKNAPLALEFFAPAF